MYFLCASGKSHTQFIKQSKSTGFVEVKNEPPDKFTSNFFFRKTGASFPIHFIKFCSIKISLMLGSRCSTSNLGKKETEGLETVSLFQQKQVGTPIFPH